jgi:excisionase family DNA binding protein
MTTFWAGTTLLTPEDVARRLQVQVETIRNYLRAGKLKGIHIARQWRVTEEALAQFVQEIAAAEEEMRK